MTLNNVTMRRTHNSSLQQQQQRWSIPADGKHLLVQKDSNEYNPQKRYTINPDDYYRRSWSSESSDSVISSESGSNCYRVVLIGEHGVGKSSLANIFAGVHDSIDSDCEVLGGRCLCLPWGVCVRLQSALSAVIGTENQRGRLIKNWGNKHLKLITKTDSTRASLLRKQESKIRWVRYSPTMIESLWKRKIQILMLFHFQSPAGSCLIPACDDITQEADTAFTLVRHLYHY